MTGEDRTAYSREYYRKNKERLLAQQAKYREKNREKLRAASRAHHAANREEMSKKTLEWKRANPERTAELNKRSAEKIKLSCFALFGGKCQRCGFDDPRALQIDHVNGAHEDRRDGRRAGLKLYSAIVNGKRNLAEYQLLCANCNWIKRHENDECRKNRKERAA